MWFTAEIYTPTVVQIILVISGPHYPLLIDRFLSCKLEVDHYLSMTQIADANQIIDRFLGNFHIGYPVLDNNNYYAKQQFLAIL